MTRPAEHAYVPLANVAAWEPVAAIRNVASVAREPGGFLDAYRRAGGNPNRLPPGWRRLRERSIETRLAAMRKGATPLYEPDGAWAGGPTKAHLGLLLWAYSPDREGLIGQPRTETIVAFGGRPGRSGTDPGFCEGRNLYSVLPGEDVRRIDAECWDAVCPARPMFKALRKANAIYVGVRTFPEVTDTPYHGREILHRTFDTWAVEASEYNGQRAEGQKADADGLLWFVQRATSDVDVKEWKSRLPPCGPSLGDSTAGIDGFWLDVAGGLSANVNDPVLHAFDVEHMERSVAFVRKGNGNVAVYTYPRTRARPILTFAPTPVQVLAMDRGRGIVRIRASQIVGSDGTTLEGDARSRVSAKIRKLMHEGKPQKQAVAMALSMERAGRLGPKGGYQRVRRTRRDELGGT